MKNRFTCLLGASVIASASLAQVSPAISSWLQNTTGITGRHYVSGNSTPIADTYLANVQSVKYSASFVYVNCTGIPSYVIGPYLDGNPNQGTDNANLYKIPLAPVANSGSLSPTTGGTIGIFINGVSLFDYRDGVSWQNSTSSLKGGPLGGTGDNVWNRDAIVGERLGFDCSKGHPAFTNYHHHQNPSAFNLDLTVISTICGLYASDALYVINTSAHSPLIGYAYDGFPIYGAYGYKNVDGTGGIIRMKSSFSLRSMSTRTTLYTSTVTVTSGPPVSGTYPLGYFKEDYQYVPTTTLTPDYLDVHNGRFCVTPEYPLGTYCYFATVDANHNSAYPYVVGPTFYGVKNVTKPTSIGETTTTYTTSAPTAIQNSSLEMAINIYPNPSADLIMIQSKELLKNDLQVELSNVTGQVVAKKEFYQGSTICYFETTGLYNGTYFLTVSDKGTKKTFKVIVNR